MTSPTTLRALAEAATQEWSSDVWNETDGNGWRATGPHHEEYAHDHGSEPGSPDEQAARRDAEFIDAASPSVVIALLDRIAAARTARDELADIARLRAEVESLKARQQELLATIVRVTNETPFSDEAKDVLEQRGKLVAEVGTLKERVTDWKRQTSTALVRAATAEDAVSGLRAECEAVKAENERMRKHVEINDEEYKTMKDVLRAEHQECQRLRAVLKTVGAMDDLDTLGRMKVFREDVPTLFNDEDGTALHLQEAVQRALAEAK